MATYTLETQFGALLTSLVASYDTVPAATKARYHLVDLENIGGAPAKVWLWLCDSGTTPNLTTLGVDLRNDAPARRVHNNTDANALAVGYLLAPGQGINFASTPVLLKASGQVYAMTDYAQYGVTTANIFSTTEAASAAGTSTYSATTAADSAAAYTASPANGDMVGRRIENGNAFLICTSNTATVITGTDGWRDKQTGLPAATPTNGTAYTILASLRDVGKTALAQDVFSGHLITSNAKTGRIVGNNAGIATYGTTYQILLGGWSGGGNPGSNVYFIDNLVRLLLNWTEEA